MKVSIVIPAYNEENTVTPTIKAALAQNYIDFEVIVVNNASSDKTAEIVQNHINDTSLNKDGRLRLVNEPRKGLLWAREGGRINAKGDIIAHLDADCLPNKDWISKEIPYFADQNVVAVSGPYDYYDGNFALRYGTLIGHKYLYSSFNIILRLMKKGGYIVGGNAFIRASALKQIGGYTTSIDFWGEDTDTASRLSKVGKIVFKGHLVMKTSARRFRNQGFWKTTLQYQINFLKMSIGKHLGKK